MDTAASLSLLRATPSTARWMGLAFAAAAITAVLVLAVAGAGERGTDDALKVTARMSFLLFWLAYVGSALVTLLGRTFQPLKRRGREFGLAFASAHTVHVGLIVWLCWIGAAPAVRVFVFFGIALACMYLLALGSIAWVRRALGAVGWRILMVFGMNYIAYAFAVDFIRLHQPVDVKFIVGYLPFAGLSVLGPALVVTALMVRAVRTRGPVLPALLPGAGRHPGAR